LHPDTPLEITNDVVKKIEKAISQYDEVTDIATSIGSTGDQVGSASIETLGGYQARIITNLTPKGLSTERIVTDLAMKLKMNIKIWTPNL
jgi:multidrug efflux pump subunit AcrB